MMKMIIAPAKKMVENTDFFEGQSTPIFLEDSKKILKYLKGKDYETLKNIWKCNDSLAELNYHRLQAMDLENATTPAILAYTGLQYQAMAPDLFSKKGLKKVKNSLYILSGFYGLVRPFDKITPYRLEMQAKVEIEGTKNLYDFWGNKIYQEVFKDKEIVVNLASKEYAKVVEKYLQANDKYLTCSFKKKKGDKYVQQATAAKMARGDMVRYISENEIEDIESLKKFTIGGYHYCENLSHDNELVFVKND